MIPRPPRSNRTDPTLPSPTLSRSPGRADKQHTGQRRPLPPWRPRSLQARQLMAASLGLVAFLALAGYALDRAFVDVRSEEHTSELQSLMRHSYAVFCLNKNKYNNTATRTTKCILIS